MAPAQKHVKTHRDIVNPAKLDAARRDSVCQQCHLTGAARVPAAGPRSRNVSSWRFALGSPDGLCVGAGERRAGGNRSFRTTGREQVQVGVGRHACGAGPATIRMHARRRPPGLRFIASPASSCHAQKGCALGADARAAAGDDCASCHMPKGRSREGEHVVYTDHTIVRRPCRDRGYGGIRNCAASGGRPAEERDLAIAYASFGGAALPLLEKLRSSDDAAGARYSWDSFTMRAGKEDCRGSLRAGAPARSVERRGGGEPGDLPRAERPRQRSDHSVAGRFLAQSRARGGRHQSCRRAVRRRRSGQRLRRTVRRLLRFHPDLEAVRQLAAKLR